MPDHETGLLLLQAVANQPVVIALEANSAFETYRSGIFQSSGCGRNINHAVVVVGYGTDAATRTPFWLIRNSWGSSDWGEAGYMRMRRGVNTCGLVNFSPSFPTVMGEQHGAGLAFGW
jgi:C1A family cysteine protease